MAEIWVLQKILRKINDQMWKKRAHQDIIDALIENNAIDEKTAIDLMDIFLDKETVDKYAHDLVVRKIITQAEDGRYYILSTETSKKDHPPTSKEKG